MLVVNFFAGPGAGKTTLAHAVTAHLKMMGRGMVVEYVGEYAKRLLFENRKAAMSNQILVLGRQFQELGNLWGKADIVVTDGPILHGMIYGRKLNYPPVFFDLALWADRQFDNMNVVVERIDTHPFEQIGRLQDFQESKEIDLDIKDMLRRTETGIAYSGPPTDATTRKVAEMVLERVQNPIKKPRPLSWFELIGPKEYRAA